MLPLKIWLHGAIITRVKHKNWLNPILFMLLFVVLWQPMLRAQTNAAIVSGTIVDSVNFRNMAYSTVTLIGKNDSIIYGNAFAAENGEFTLKQIPYGNYILMVTRPGYADFDDKINVFEPTLDLGTIYMILKENLLKEFVVKEWTHAIRIKGDTTEFLADSFLNNPNATVEDLLKKLPGIQVDRSGKITAQGETVKRVLVDGEEFFGDDPTVATRNLKAENIEKVQVFDSRSDQSLLTGVEDNEKEKTINLTLKDDAKKGYFGKARSAYGPSQTIDRFENEAMFNNFNSKRKWSAFGTFTNTNQTGLSWSDRDKYAGGSGETTIDEESGNVITTYTQNEDDMLMRSGIPRTSYIGTYYSNKFNDGKQAVNGTFSHRNFSVGGFDNNYTKYILPDTVYFNDQKKDFTANRTAINANGRIDIKLDSSSSLRINFKASSQFGNTFSVFNTRNFNGLEQLVNTNNRTDSSEMQSNSLNATAFYSKRFKTKGRSFSAQIQTNINQNNRDGYLISTTRFFGINDSLSAFDQRKQNQSSESAINAKFTYTEPLTEKLFLVSEYSLNTRLNRTKNTTLEKTGADYSFFVDSLSNHFDYDVIINQGGLTLKYAAKKLNVSMGGKIGYTDLVQTNLLRNETQNQPFYNFFPAANINYKIKNTSSFNIGYNGSTRQPSLQQIQPLQDNTNPLVLYVGNTSLVQSFTNNVSVNYNSYAPLKGRGIYANLNFNQTNNAFTNFDRVNAQGVREFKTVNVDGNYYLSSYGYLYFELKKIGLDVSINFNGSFSNNNNFINGLANNNKNISVGTGLYLGYEIDEIFDVNIGFDIDYNQTTSSLRRDIPFNFYTTNSNADLTVKLPGGFVIKPQVNYDYRQKTADFDRDLNVWLFNASVSKKLTKSKKLELSVFAYDIFNQNIGFRRNASSNFVNEQTYVVLQRYVLFGITYHLSGGGAKKINNDDEDY